MGHMKLAVAAVGFAIVAATLSVQADDTMNKTTNAIEHPETTLHQSEAQSADKTMQVSQQKKAEAKARLDQAKKDYEKSLQANGADNSVTKDAKSRLNDARKEYHKYAMKTSKAAKDLKEDNQKVMEDKATQ